MFSSSQKVESESFFLIDLSGSSSLLEDSQAQQLDKLYDLAKKSIEDKDSPFVAILRQKGGGGSSIRILNQDFGQSLHRDQIRLRIYKLRYICRSMRKSSSRWIYTCKDACFSEYAELALSCDSFICYAANLHFGFPELNCGYFPLCGVFEGLSLKDQGVLDDWIQRPVRCVDDSSLLGADAYLPSTEWQEMVSLTVNHVRKRVGSGEKSDGLLQYYGEVLQVLPPSKVRSWGDRSQLDLALSQLRRYRDRKTIAEKVTNSAASYLTSFQGRYAESPIYDGNEGLVFIDLSECIPPLDFLVQLMGSYTKLVVCAGDSNKLKYSLNRICKELLRTKDKDLLGLWDAKSIAVVSNKITKYDLRIKVVSPKIIEVSTQGEREKFLLISRGRDESCILISNRENTSILESTFAFTMICIDDGIKLSDLIRSCFIEEICSLAARVSVSPPSILDEIIMNWPNAFDLTMWDDFLGERKNREQLKDLGNLSLKDQNLKASSVAQLESLCREHIDGEIGDTVKISCIRYLEKYCDYMVDIVLETLEIQERSLVEALVYASLGCRSIYRKGGPLSLRQQRHYLKQFRNKN